ncbi:hypothetical protein SADUNF_Sadunf06G0105700 [Salix dunnii]|uniref:Uncharacterized protein n=1 Tax=Salix dunnii TaxID=1413687 RepID=A0A835N2Y0_9ROSI|nr:hypothetical protein SADUNF_Sadunf06G0105700 [Salix dunnii]
MGFVGRGENKAIFKLQEIGSEFRETNFQTHRFQRDRCESQGEFVMIEKKNRTVVVWLLGYWMAMKVVAMIADRITDDRQESGFLERVAMRVAEEKGVVFCGREEKKKRKQPKGVEKKRRQKEKGVDVAWCRREEEKEEDKARMRR